VKAVNCYKCSNYRPLNEWDNRSPCEKGHKPRFYKGKGLRWNYENPKHWGHKRICDDYKERSPRPTVIVEYGYGRKP
jgi:hypothetical protein